MFLIRIQRDSRERLVCSSPECNYVVWDNPTPVVAAIVEQEGKIILARNSAWRNFFGLIAGFMEAGEHPETAILRELEEELGLTGTIASFIGYYAFPEKNHLILAFHIKATGTVTLSEEIAEIKLVDPKDLKPWPMGTGPAVRDWLRQQNLLTTTE